MGDQNLTKASIQSVESASAINLAKELFEINNFTESPNILIIQSASENCMRLTIYPLKKERIIKISLNGSNISILTLGCSSQ